MAENSTVRQDLVLSSDHLIGGKYRAVEWIGGGPMSDVFKARDVDLRGLPVAIKFLMPPRNAGGKKHLGYLERETVALVRLYGHSYIVQLKDFGWFEDRIPYLVMDFMPRGSLKDRLAKGQLMPLLQHRVLEELCDALDFIHSQRVVHQDLKPSNIFFDRGYHIRIGDYGIAEALEGAYPEVVTAGTPGYRAPEQEDEQLAVDHRADIYALGIVTWEILTGRRPDPEALFHPRLHPELVKAIRKACSSDPSDRYDSAGAFWKSVRTWLPRVDSGGLIVAPDAQFGHLVAQMPMSHRDRIRRVLEDYTAVFGGRDRELETLDEWLFDSERPCGLVQAPTGRGKTALLTNWALEMQYSEWQVVFYPVSRRYETADINTTVRCLSHTLAPLFDADPPGSNQSPEVVRAQIVEWLRHGVAEDECLLLVVDGLDEALGDHAKSLLPGTLGPGVKVLASARPLAGTGSLWWVNQLKWDVAATRIFDLDILSHSDMVHVLRAQPSDELNSLADDAAFVDDFARVSEGDPLTARVIIDALRAGEVTPESLGRRPPGLDAYLEEWMRQLEKRAESEAAWRLLGLCAVAFGPLTSDDVASLSSDVFRTSRDVRQAVQAVERFIVGEGDPDSGYVFSHPRLQEYFEDQLLDPEREAHRDAFVRYGQRVFDELPAKPCPAYIRRFWLRHLCDAGKWEDVYDVVATGSGQELVWAEAHHSASGSYAGYLSDLSLAWQHADEIGASKATEIGRQLRYALIASSVHSVAGKIPTSLPLALVRHAIWTPQNGLDHVLLMPDWGHRKEALTRLVPYLPEPLRKKARRELQKAQEALSSVPASPNVVGGLFEWHWSESEWKERKRELTAARAEAKADDRAAALLKLAKKLPKGDRRSVLREAWGIAQAIERAGPRVAMMREIARYLPESDLDLALEKALERARATTCADIRAMKLSDLERYLPEANQRTALGRALMAMGAQAHTRSRASPSATSGSDLLKTEEQLAFGRALEVAKLIGGEDRARATALAGLTALVSRLAESQLLEEALNLARALPKLSVLENPRAEALTALAPYMSEAQRGSVLQDALDAVRFIGDADDRAQVLVTLASHLREALGERALTVEEIFKGELEDLTLDLKEGGHSESSDGSQALATKLSYWQGKMSKGVLTEEEAREFANWVCDLKFSWESMTYDQAPSLSQDDVREVRHALTRGNLRSAFTVRDLGLVGTACGLTKQGYAKEALATACAIEDKRERAETLARLGPHMPQPLRRRALEEAYAVAGRIQDPADLAKVLARLARHPQLSSERLYSLWPGTLHRLARHSREDLLSSICSLVPLISRLGGEEAIVETCHAIQDVGRWWP